MGDIDRIYNVSLLCESLAAQGDRLRTMNEKRAARCAQRPALARPCVRIWCTIGPRCRSPARTPGDAELHSASKMGPIFAFGLKDSTEPTSARRCGNLSPPFRQIRKWLQHLSLS
jgi:hypothetical protein